MQVILSDRVWLPISEMEPLRVTRLKEMLTKTPYIAPDYRFDEEPEPVELFEERNGFIGVPRGFFMSNARIDHQVVDERSSGEEIPEEQCAFEGVISGSDRFNEQTQALEIVQSLYGQGASGGIVQAVPAWGKTAFAIRVVCRLRRRTLVGVHKEFLANQWQARFHKMAPYLKVGIWQGKKEELEGTDVVVAMIQTLTQRDVPQEVADSFGLCIWDECFVSGTSVQTRCGDVPIEQVREGDVVRNAVGYGVVDGVMSREVHVDRLCLVEFEDGSSCVCTEEHPFLTMDGWVKADDLVDHQVLTWNGCIDTIRRHGTRNPFGLSVVRQGTVGQARQEVLLQGVLRAIEKEADPDALVQGMWGADEAEKIVPMFSGVCGDLAQANPHRQAASRAFSAHEGVAQGEPAGCSRGIGKNEASEPDVTARCSRISECEAEGDRTSASREGRKWSCGSDAEETVRCSWGRLGDGVRRLDEEEDSRASDVLQGGHCPSCQHGGCRGRWSEPQQPAGTSERREEGRGLETAGVVRVSRVERSDLERRGLHCDGDTVLVWNLSVSGHPSYVLSSGAVVHNCHRVGARTWSQVPPVFRPRFHLGLSARPKRADRMDDVIRWLVGPVVFKAKYQTPVPRVHRIHTIYARPQWMREVEDNGDNPRPLHYSTHLKALVHSMPRNARIVDELERILRHPVGRKIVVMSERVKHLDAMAELLRDKDLADPIPGFSMGFVHGKVGKKAKEEAERKRVIFTCVSEDTKCLTFDGWKNHRDLRVGEMIAAYDKESGQIKYTPLLEVSSYEHDGSAAHINRIAANILMTWNHRNVVLRKKKGKRLGRGEFYTEEEVVCASQLTRRDKLRVFAPMSYPELPSGVGGDMAELLGWIIAEGTYTPDGGIVLYQNEGEDGERIDLLIRRMGVGWRRKDYRPGQWSWFIPLRMAQGVKRWCPDKKLSSFLVSLPREEAHRLFDALVRGDGHRRKDGEDHPSFVQKDRCTAEWFMILAMRLGYHPVLAHESTYRVYLSKREFVGLQDKRFHVEEVHYKGTMWCPRTEYGTWVGMRDGSVFITGNTFQMLEEGFDISALDTLVMTTARADVEQPVGRIRRECRVAGEGATVTMQECKYFCPWRAGKCESKPKPIVVEFTDPDVHKVVKKLDYRTRYYKEIGAEIREAR